ncbi:MAG TPA: hypothetical protein PKD78_11465, partial [Saprospiraceae bacterium]|nr:hypothetical protein [Saprospiraceae bacterium]
MPPFHLHIGCDFDGPVHTPASEQRAGQPYLGPNRLLLWLEQQLGCGGFPENTDYLRIELYRQALSQTEQPDSFYAASF